MDSTRRITFGSLYEKADADYDGSSITGYLEAGLASIEVEEFWLQPMASLQYTYLDSESFTEKGAPGLNLNAVSESTNSIMTNLGLRVYRSFSMDGEADLIPELRVRWAHEFGDRDREVRAYFDDAASSQFTVDGAEVGRDAAIIGAGWTVVGEDNVSLNLNYDATVNEDLVSHAITLGVLIYW